MHDLVEEQKTESSRMESNKVKATGPRGQVLELRATGWRQENEYSSSRRPCIYVQAQTQFYHTQAERRPPVRKTSGPVKCPCQFSCSFYVWPRSTVHRMLCRPTRNIIMHLSSCGRYAWSPASGLGIRAIVSETRLLSVLCVARRM